MLSIISTVLAVAVTLTSPLSPVGAAPGGAAAGGAGQEQNQVAREPVDLNTATAEQLQEVPGIGEALAQRIVEFRGEHGPFEKVDDLLNVRGIGVTSLDRLRPFLTIKRSG